MPKTRPLPASRLRAELDPKRIPYADSREIPNGRQPAPPQPRALAALNLALSIDDPGYNVYLAGGAHMGRTYFLRNYLAPRAAKLPTPPDWIYLHNFDDPDRPKAVSLPAGQGRALRTALSKAMADVRREIPERLETEAWIRRRESLARTHQAARDKLFDEMEQAAASQGFDVGMDDQGALTLYPLVEGKVVSDAEFDRLEPGLRRSLKRRSNDILKSMKATLREISTQERGYRASQRELEGRAAREVLEECLAPLRKHFGRHKAVLDHLEAMRSEILDGIDHFLHREALREGDKPAPGGHGESAAAEDFYNRFGVNLFVDNGDMLGAPVVICDHPTESNLLGCLEREAELGALYTDFTLAKAGDLHKANGGFLIVHMEEVAGHPDAWDGLLRALRSGRARVEEAGDGDGARTKTIEPDPVPLCLKVILVGTDETFEHLLLYDDRFPKLFKIKAHMQDTMERTAAGIRGFVRRAGSIIAAEGLPPFDRAALAGLVDFASRLAEDQKKISLRWPLVRELMVESAALARQRRKRTVTRAVLDEARRHRDFRSNLLEEEFMAEYDRQLIKVATSGSAVGRANGLSVTWFGDYEFGLPHQIACTVGVGHGGILDLEREAELGGPIHTKGMMILKSYLLGLFAQDKPLVLTGSLCFEQSYAEVEGDSASGAELAALLSALAEVPINLSMAFTGAVSQSGAVMAVGGVNRKVEGFFEVCRRRGLTGGQGVIVPQDNVVHLMLKDEVAMAVRDRKFNIWPVTHIEQALELLTGLTAGRPTRTGFSTGSLFDRVNTRLTKLAKLADYGRR